MATFVSSSTNKTQGASSLTVTLPTGLSDGDLLIAVWASNNSTTTLTADPSGWDSLDNAPVANGTLYTGIWFTFYSAGMANPTWTLAVNQKMVATVVAYRGVSGTTPYVLGSETLKASASTNLAATGLTTTFANQVVLAAFVARLDNVTTITGPSGMTLVNGAMTTGGGAVTSHIYTETVTSPGSSGTQTVSYDVSGTYGYAVQIALVDVRLVEPPSFIGWGTPLILAPTAPSGSGTIFGVNSALNSWSGGTNLAYATRGQWFGRVPCGRGYPTPLPSSGNFGSGGTEWGWAGGTFGENRVNICFKFNDTDMANQVAIGTHDSTIISYINSVPSDWTVFLTFFHEYNLHIDTNNTVADFIAAFKHLGELCAANNPAGNVVPTICGSSFGWDNANCPPASDMPANTLFLMDNYGNPNGTPSGYKNYGTAYPTAASVIDAWYDDIVTGLGYTNWGVGEFNAPQRVAPALSSLNSTLGWGPQSPHDIDGSLRTQWITDYCNYVLSKPVKPQVILLWEGGNGGWNQYFTSAGAAKYDDGTAASPGANYQAWPITIDSAPLIAAYKAFIDISA